MDARELKVLMISSDRKVLEEGSAVAQRMKEYGQLVAELHIVLLSTTSHKLSDKTLSERVFVYPTNSSTKLHYVSGAAKKGRQIIFDKKFVRGKSLITTQDPFECGWAGLKIKNKWRLPLEVQLHTDPFSPYFNGLLNTFRKHIARRVIREADTIRVVSESVGKKVVEQFSKKGTDLVILPIYIERQRIENDTVTFDAHVRFGWRFVLLSVARLTKEKNLPLALEVLQKVRTTFPDVGLVIVGDGPEKDRLERIAKKLKIEKFVTFVGWQDHLASYYRTSNLFLQTSYFEGYGMAFVEAALSRTAIVSTPVGIASDFRNGEDLYLCPHNNAEYMADAVKDLIKNNQLRETFRMNMKEAIEKKLLSKEQYLKELQKAWQMTVPKIHS